LTLRARPTIYNEPPTAHPRLFAPEDLMMMTEMLKQLTLSVFGLVLGVAVLAANTDTALADRGNNRWVEGSPRYSNNVRVTKRSAKNLQKRSSQQRFQDNLDFETEAVWRNLRPSRFSD